jgi:hypothetical protein
VSKFRRDFHRGRRGEDEVEGILRPLGCGRNEEKKLKDKRGWDLKFTLDGRERFGEVKADRMEAKTQNIALEFFNPKKNEPSGLMATTSEFWFVVLDDPRSVWVASVEKLRAYVAANPPVRTVERGGDGNSSMWLYPSSQILRACFREFTGAGPERAAQLLRELLDG